MSLTSTALPDSLGFLAKLGQNPAKWIVVTIMVVVCFLSLTFARKLIEPVDSLVTEYACSQYGDEVARPLLEYQRSNRFGLFNRTYASCSFGPVDAEAVSALPVEYDDDGEPLPLPVSPYDDDKPVTLAMSEIEPVTVYQIVKMMGVVLQLGAASLILRLVGEPMLSRFVRKSE